MVKSFHDSWQRFNRNRLSTLGLVLFILILITCLVTPWLPLEDPNQTDLKNRLLNPLESGYVLGSDQLGRDVLSRLLWGTRVSLSVGLIATLFAALLGSMIGLVSGYFRGWTDNILMRFIDALMTFPYMLLALAIVAIFGPGLLNALLAIAIVNIPFFARTVRGITVGLVNKEFIDAAKLGGASHGGILWKELLPNVLPVIVVTASTTSGWMILETAGLSFLGLGAQPPTADLGSMLGEGRKLLFTSPYLATIPGGVILVIVISLNLLGDGIRDVLDPRLRGGSLRSPLPSMDVLESNQSSTSVKKNDSNIEPALQVNGLSVDLLKYSKYDPLIRDVDLVLPKGESLGIIGESGSGKSIMALSITSLAPSPPLVIRRGSVIKDEKDLLKMSLSDLQNVRGKKIAYIFQDPLSTLNPVLTVGKQLVQSIQRHQSIPYHQAKKKSIELLKMVHIPYPEERFFSYSHQLSGGMRQRVCIAMALSNSPEILIADEPTTALDVTIQAEILSLLYELKNKLRLSIVFITHDLGVVSVFCDRIAVMYAGQIIEAGAAKAVLDDPQHPYTRALLSCSSELGSKKKLTGGIPGLPPQPGNFPEGCGFAARCPHVEELCIQSMPKLKKIGKREVRCILAENKTGVGI